MCKNQSQTFAMQLLPQQQSVAPIRSGRHQSPLLQVRLSSQSLHQSQNSGLSVYSAAANMKSMRNIESAASVLRRAGLRLGSRLASMMKLVFVRNANLNSGAIDTKKIGSAAGIARALPRQERVFNITVDKAHCYYANGVLVSNCDALQYMMLGAGEGDALSGRVRGADARPKVVVSGSRGSSRRRVG